MTNHLPPGSPGHPANWAGHGYAVVTVDDTYEPPKVQFPNGPLATMPPPPATPDADGRSLPEGLARALDPADVGAFGPSMCRTAAARWCS